MTLGIKDSTECVLINPLAQEKFSVPPPNREPLKFHSQLPGYAPTRLIDASHIAEQLQVGKVWVKDESMRFGLPAFKILGASWAVYRTLAKRLGFSQENFESLEQFKQRIAVLKPLTLVAATDGNHGRAVAHMAKLLGLDAHIFVPDDMADARREAIKNEGATLTVIDGTYDDAIVRSAKEASESRLVISDTSWAGYEDVPLWVTAGYSTIFWEIDDQLAKLGQQPPDIVAVQIGVGALAMAVVQHYRRPELLSKPKLIGVEPMKAACILASVRAGKIVEVPGPHESIMAGLNCGVPSQTAWPVISKGLDILIAVEDEYARQSMRLLAKENMIAGETGGSGLAGILKLKSCNEAEQARELLGMSRKLAF